MGSVMILKGIMSVVALLAYQTTHSEMVMPVLYGWYTDVTEEYEDACLENHYKYKNLETGTAFELAQKVLVPVNNRKDCYWQKIVLKNESDSPDDFPGTNEQWEQLEKNPSTTTQKASRACVDSNEIERDSISMIIYPSYRCPKGSYHSLDPITLSLGCSTKPLGCYGDIVGRDLDTANKEGDDKDPIGIKHLGHIGLTYPSLSGSSVLEVLKDNPVVQDNHMEDFKNKTRFWGQRYGTQSKKNIDFISGIKIMNAALQQKSCSTDTEYTFSWSFSPCGDEKKPAKFRCDSFVYYAYLTGANIDLGYTPLITYPSTIFKSMLNCREQSGVPCNQNIPDPEIESTNVYVLKPTILVAQKVRKILAADELNINELDIASYTYVKSKDETRENKIKLLWDLAIKYQSNPIKSSYLIDIMSELDPIEKTDEIIRAFQETNNHSIKLRYLRLLLGSVPNSRMEQSDHVSHAKTFIMSLLQTSQDEDILRTVIVNFPGYFMDDGSYFIMIDRVEEQKNQHPENFKKIIANSSFWYHWLGLANKDAAFNSVWIDKLSKQSDEYANYDYNDSFQDTERKKPSLLSRQIHRSFKFALESREKQNKAFQVPTAIKKKLSLLIKEDEPFLSDEMNETFKRLKEATAKRDAWMRNKTKEK